MKSGEPESVARSPLPGWFKPAAWCLSLALIIAAIVVAFLQRDTVAAAAHGVRNAPAHQIIALLLLPAVSTFLSAATFWQVSRKYGRVGYGEMFALMGSAWVLNLLPLKPGLVGRVSYHARYNGIGVKDSIKILLEASAAGIVGVALLAYPLLRAHFSGVWIDFIGAPLWLGCVCIGIYGFARPASMVPGFLAAALFRMLDAFAWTLRYGIILELVGMHSDIGTAFLIAAAAQAAMYVPLGGNGLGVREWAVGLVAAWTGNSGLGRDVFVRTMSTGLTIDLLNRAAEMLVLVPLGLGCCGWVARRVRIAEAAASAGLPSSNPR